MKNDETADYRLTISNERTGEDTKKKEREKGLMIMRFVGNVSTVCGGENTIDCH